LGRVLGRDRRCRTLVFRRQRTAAQYAGGEQDGNGVTDFQHVQIPPSSCGEVLGEWAAQNSCWRLLPLNRRRTTTKKTGTRNTASRVAVIMPLMTPVPMARWLPDPAPLAMTSGSTPRMKASEVMMMGR